MPSAYSNSFQALPWNNLNIPNNYDNVNPTNNFCITTLNWQVADQLAM